MAMDLTDKKTKIIIFYLLTLLGAVLFAYGIFFHFTNILPQQPDDPAVRAASESVLIREVSVGGVARDTSGKLRQTYTGRPPQACPT
jgi:hypothetical protein